MTWGAILLTAKALAPTGEPPSAPPDVELKARAEAREVSIEQEGPIRLELRAEPGLTDVKVERSQPPGATSYRNLTIDARVATWLSRERDGAEARPAEGSTGEPPQ